MRESDIADYERWFSCQTQWASYDAPWEPIEAGDQNGWQEYYESVKGLAEDAQRWKMEIAYCGRHIGWVCTYLLDKEYQWISAEAVQEGQRVFRAVGIDICEPEIWGCGVGTRALRAWMAYWFDHGCGELYTQTWSGNVRMLRSAEKLGFVECDRKVGLRRVDGERYDALTFRLEKC